MDDSIILRIGIIKHGHDADALLGKMTRPATYAYDMGRAARQERKASGKPISKAMRMPSWWAFRWLPQAKALYGHDERLQGWKRGVDVREKLVASGKLLPSARHDGPTSYIQASDRTVSARAVGEQCSAPGLGTGSYSVATNIDSV